MEHELYENSPYFRKKNTMDGSSKLKSDFCDIISFSGNYGNYCVGIVDIVNSTKISALLSGEKIGKYYSTFLNTMGMIVRKYGGVAVKNLGDSLLYYFPEVDFSNKASSIEPLECGIEMIKSRGMINTKMEEYELPSVSFRISIDYGVVLTAKSIYSPYDDIFGPSVNLCAKINSMAPPNGMVIGGDLYQMVKSFEEYSFKPVIGYSAGLKLQYPVYFITASNKNGN